MEYLIFMLAVCLFFIFVFVKGIYDQHRQDAWLKNRLRDSFGCVSQKSEETEKSRAVQGYFRHHQDDFYIDDITWNDLELERIFSGMDITQSSAGQEYLYYMLRTPVFSKELLERREELIRFFTEEEEIRLKLQMLYAKLGKTGKYSIYEYIGFLDQLGQRSNMTHILSILLVFAGIFLLLQNAALGLFALLGAIGWNIAAYLKEKREIEPYLISFKYVFRAIDAGRKLTEITDAPFMAVTAKEQERIKELLRRFSGLKRTSRYGLHEIGGSSNPLEIVADYINMIFHVDLIGFNLMLGQLRSHEKDIDELLSILGRMEALIAAASWRQSLPVWCEPKLTAADTDPVCLSASLLYHPLIRDAVKNDIRADRGVLLTGSNASGKSTFLKATAVNAILAQTIHTCAAAVWQGNFCRVMSSMALRDDLAHQESYYIVEIKSLKRILDSVKAEGAPVFAFVDEVLRGTNTVERIAASTQILKSLRKKGVLCFAATHDIELTELLEQEYDNYHFQEQIENGDVIFPYKLIPGRAQTRNAIRLLSVMGYEDAIIEEADALAADFLQNGRWK